MAIKDLNLEENYGRSSGWGEDEGVRDYGQNMLDGHDQGYPMRVEHRNGWTCLINEGCVLPFKVWRMGWTDKTGTNLRGRHGDGLKVGTLALLRSGIEVKIYNGEEIWTPKIERCDDGEMGLRIHTRKRRMDEYGDRGHSDFTAMLKIDKYRWNARHGARFLPLMAVPADDIVTVRGQGSLLKGSDWAGRIYAQGVYVCQERDLDYGYDFDDIELDRDRRTVDHWDLQGHITNLMSEIAKSEGTWAATTYAMLVTDTGDVANMSTHMGWRSSDLSEQIAACFVAEHGAEAVPVHDGGDADKAEHYGLQPVVVPRNLVRVLEPQLGSLKDRLAKAVDDSGKQIAVSNLDAAEYVVYAQVLNLLHLADVVDVDKAKSVTRIFEFSADGAPRGTFHMDSGEIRIRRDMLRTQQAFLAVMIHEVCHADGIGNSHAVSMEAAWEAVAAVLLEVADLGGLLD